MDFAVPEHRFSVPGMREEQLHTGTTPFKKLLSLFSDGGSTSQAPWSALERKGSGTSTSAAPKPALTAAQKQELAAANGRSQKIKRGQKRSNPSEDGTGACDDGAAEEEELDMSKLTPEEREQLANADVKEAKRLRRLLRNRCSAQLARERRKVYISELEAKVAAHEQRIEELEGKLANTEHQNAVLRRIIRTMRPAEGAEPVPLPPVDAVRLRETAAAAAAAAAIAAADVGAAAADAAPGSVQPGVGSRQGSPQLVQQMDVDQQQRQGLQNVPCAQQAMPQQVVPQMSMAPPAAIMAARSMRTSTPEPPTPQLPPARQQQPEALCLHHMHAQQQLSQQQQQQQQQQGVVPALPPLPPAPRPAQISMQQRVEHSMELGPFSVAYRASLEAQKLHQQKEQEEQQQQQQQQRSRYQGPPPQQLQQQPQRQQRHEPEQYGPRAGMQYDCDTSALFGRGSLPVPIVPKSQLQQLLMQQQLQQEEEQRQQQQQDQRMYAQSFSQGGNRMDVHPPHSEAQSHGNNSSSLHVVPTSSWRSHSRPSHSNPMPQQRMQQAKQYESYSFPGQYDADAVAQKYSDALGVVPKRHRSSHGSSRRARDVVHVVPDVGAMSFPPDELLAALLSA